MGAFILAAGTKGKLNSRFKSKVTFFIPRFQFLLLTFDAFYHLTGKRYSLPNSRIMIHQPLGGAQGAQTDIDIQVITYCVVCHNFYFKCLYLGSV